MRRGVSLLEVLVVSFLALMLLGLLHRLLVPVMRTNSRTSVQVHLRQQATQTLTHLANDLRASGGAGLSYLEGQVLSISSPTGLVGSGRKLYGSEVVVYHYNWAAGEVRRRAWDGTSPTLGVTFPPDRPTLLEAESLRALGTEPSFGRLLASGVTEFVPLDHWPPQPSNTCKIVLVRQAGPNQVETLTVYETVGFRN